MNMALRKAEPTANESHLGAIKHRDLTTKRVVRDLISLKTCVELEPRGVGDTAGDITIFSDAVIPSLRKRINELTHPHDLKVEEILFRHGFPYTCVADEGPRVYVTRSLYIDLSDVD